ncbi:MAG: phosphatidylserine/phosphatidylglycerophosphate/cardiolipin synthase family protein [Chlamydiales bacterium]|nr:phosphatidylserine/phosphatidylglycerophosphate/cardiolipin synthase family protein [Chlamydiales bacterium]
MVVAAFFLIPFSPVIMFLIIALAPFTLLGLKGFIKIQTSQQEEIKAIEQSIYPAHLSKANSIYLDDCKGYCTKDSIESNELKFKLIEKAKHNIIISGCYCGGDVFDKYLDLIKSRLKQIDTLKVYLLSSDIWLTDKNKRKIKHLSHLFPDQFQVVITREKNISILTDRKKIQISCNHIKALVIDDGSYFIIGGSGIVDRWNTFRGDEPIPDKLVPFYLKLTQDAVAAMAFRDCDFCFSSNHPDGIGKKLYIDLLKLITKWQIVYRASHFAIQDLQQPGDWFTKNTELEELLPLVGSLDVGAFLSGPDMQEDSFYEKLIHEIKSSKSSIYINHLYFHPSKKLLKALVDASNRGVHITLVTNSDEKRSPGQNFLFVALSKRNYQKLFEGVDKKNIEIFEFQCDNVTLHKKIIIIDDNILFTGSSNIGYTSMTSSADYELNLIVYSKEFAHHTMNKNRVDHEKCSKKIDFEQIKHPDIQTKILAPLQSSFEFLL